MRVAEPSVDLRPLGLGEILDRAVNLCVRFFVPLATIYVFYAVPLAVVTYFSSQGLTRLIDVVSNAARHGHALSQIELSQALQSQPADLGWSLVAGLFALFIAPLPTAALIEGTTASYLGRPTSVKSAYRVAFGRYPNMLGITLLFVISAVVVYAIAAFFVFVAILLLALLAAAAQGVAIALGVVFGIVAVTGAFAIIIVLVLALQLAYFCCVVERAGALTSYGRSFKRAFTGIGLRRTLLVGLIYFAIAIGIGLVSFTGEGVIVGLLRAPILGAVYQTVVRVATAAFTTAFVGVFYLDLRVREEGLDLQLATERADPEANFATP